MRSRLQQREPSEAEVRKQMDALSELGMAMGELKIIANQLTKDKHYTKAVALSYARIFQMVGNMVETIDPTDGPKVAEIFGQIRERLRLTNEIQGVMVQVENLEKEKVGLRAWLRARRENKKRK